MSEYPDHLEEPAYQTVNERVLEAIAYRAYMEGYFQNQNDDIDNSYECWEKSNTKKLMLKMLESK